MLRCYVVFWKLMTDLFDIAVRRASMPRASLNVLILSKLLQLLPKLMALRMTRLMTTTASLTIAFAVLLTTTVALTVVSTVPSTATTTLSSLTTRS